MDKLIKLDLNGAVRSRRIAREIAVALAITVAAAAFFVTAQFQSSEKTVASGGPASAPIVQPQ